MIQLQDMLVLKCKSFTSDMLTENDPITRHARLEVHIINIWFTYWAWCNYKTCSCWSASHSHLIYLLSMIQLQDVFILKCKSFTSDFLTEHDPITWHVHLEVQIILIWLASSAWSNCKTCSSWSANHSHLISFLSMIQLQDMFILKCKSFTSDLLTEHDLTTRHVHLEVQVIHIWYAYCAEKKIMMVTASFCCPYCFRGKAYKSSVELNFLRIYKLVLHHERKGSVCNGNHVGQSKYPWRDQ